MTGQIGHTANAFTPRWRRFVTCAPKSAQLRRLCLHKTSICYHSISTYCSRKVGLVILFALSKAAEYKYSSAVGQVFHASEKTFYISKLLIKF